MTKTSPSAPGMHRLNMHIVLDALALAARGEPLDPETCICIEGIVREYDHKDFTADDIQALYDCGARPVTGDLHFDDVAVEKLATAMKEKLAKKRAEGRGGWQLPDQCTPEYLSQLLRDHVRKGDPVDVANFCMMLFNRGESITALATMTDVVRECDFRAIVDEAMNYAWGDWCGDTGCFPSDFEWRGGNGTLSFTAGKWAGNVADYIFKSQKFKDIFRDTTSLQNCDALVKAVDGIMPLLDVDCPDMPDADCIGWQGDKEIPVTFGQLRAFMQALATHQTQEGK